MQNLTYSNDLLKNIKTNFEKFLFYIVMLKDNLQCDLCNGGVAL